MRGYKALEKDLKNRYGFQYEFGKKYILNGELKWSENGFHFCTRPEDTLRYVDSWNNNYQIVEVDGSGELQLYEDEYYGYYDMYVSSEMELLDYVSREELFNMVFDSNNIYRVQRLIQMIELTKYEIKQIKEKYSILIPNIEYYQNKEMILKLKNRN